MTRIRVIVTMLVGMLVLVGTLAGASLAAGHAPSAKKKPKPKPKPTLITVRASEFKFVLSKRVLTKPGTVTFTVKNVGKEAHNFVVLSGVNKATPLIKPKHSAKLTVVFKKKGSYTYECTVGEHAEEGMLGHFKVK